MANFNYLGEQAKLTELQQLAQALMQKQANPAPMGQMVGKYFIPNYGAQIAQGLDAVSEAKVSHDMPERVAAFTAGTKQATQEATKQFMDTYKTDPNAAIAMAQGSPLPGMDAFGKEAAKQQMKTFAPDKGNQFQIVNPGGVVLGINPDRTVNPTPIYKAPFGPKVTGPDQEIQYDTSGSTGKPNGLASPPPTPGGLAAPPAQPPGLAGGTQSAGVRMSDQGLANRKGLTAETEAISKEVPQQIVKNYTKLHEESVPQLDALFRASDLLDRGTFSGIGSPAEQFFSRLGSMFGMKTDPKLVNTQQYRAAVAQALAGHLGVAVSDADRLVMEVANGADIGMELEALKGIIAQKITGHFNRIKDHDTYVQNSGIRDKNFINQHTVGINMSPEWLKAHGVVEDPSTGHYMMAPAQQPAPAAGQSAPAPQQPATPQPRPGAATFKANSPQELDDALKKAVPGDIIITPSFPDGRVVQ